MNNVRSKQKGGVVNRADLINEVADVLELPHRGRRGKAHEIVKTILKTMVTALRDGQSIRVDGFGKFTVYERPATRSVCYFDLANPGAPWTKGHHAEVIDIPAKKVIKFRPANPVQRKLNER